MLIDKLSKYVVVFTVVAAALLLASSTVFSQDSSAKLLGEANFTVPDEDRSAGIHGEIKVAVDVNEKGDVHRAVVYIGPGWPCGEDLYTRVDKLLRSIEKSVANYKFSPATKDGKPVDAKLSLTLKIPSPDPNAGAAVDVKRKLVSAGVINGKALSLPRPAYPAAARAERASGLVSVKVLVNEQGETIWAQAISGHPLLMFAARDAACGSKFAPTLLQGNPVRISGVLTYNFVP
ncbi:MAG TPA: energy transducer TonB [Pyrinomonadaceae bacterium]|nr:energy transducer TonB [Pyrinomonadaceae bacterium]